LKNKAIENMKELEKKKAVSKENNYQEMLNAIAKVNSHFCLPPKTAS